VIVVTAAYRLGILGFFTTMSDAAPGNFGLMDQVAVMDWVQEHIPNFNGSEADVTIFGHSAGAVSVSLHLLSPHSAGKFQRAIAMSGNFLVPGSVKKADLGPLDELADTFYCDREPIQNLMECLRSAKLEALVKKGAEIGDWGPVVDGGFHNVSNPFLPEDPRELLKEGRILSKVPFVSGFTDMEDVLSLKADISKLQFDESIKANVLEDAPPLKDNETCVLNENLLVDSILFHYRPDLLSDDPSVFRQKYIDFATDKKYGASTFELGMHVSKVAPTYLYRFDYKIKTPTFTDNREWVNVPQQFELPLIWGMPYWTSLTPQIAWNNNDKKTSETIMTLFGNFTKFSNPAQNKKIMQWEPFTEKNPRIFIVDKNFNMSDQSSFDYKSVQFWNEYYPKIVDAANICCNVTEGSSSLRPHTLQVVLIPVVFTSLIDSRTRYIF
jgi:carboxylesterase type B